MPVVTSDVGVVGSRRRVCVGAPTHGGREGARDADLRLQEEDRRGGDEVETAAEPVRGRAQRPQPVQQEPHRVAGETTTTCTPCSVP